MLSRKTKFNPNPPIKEWKSFLKFGQSTDQKNIGLSALRRVLYSLQKFAAVDRATFVEESALLAIQDKNFEILEFLLFCRESVVSDTSSTETISDSEITDSEIPDSGPFLLDSKQIWILLCSAAKTHNIQAIKSVLRSGLEDPFDPRISSTAVGALVATCAQHGFNAGCSYSFALFIRLDTNAQRIQGCLLNSLRASVYPGHTVVFRNLLNLLYARSSQTNEEMETIMSEFREIFRSAMLHENPNIIEAFLQSPFKESLRADSLLNSKLSPPPAILEVFLRYKILELDQVGMLLQNAVRKGHLEKCIGLMGFVSPSKEEIMSLVEEAKLREHDDVAAMLETHL